MEIFSCSSLRSLAILSDDEGSASDMDRIEPATKRFDKKLSRTPEKIISIDDDEENEDVPDDGKEDEEDDEEM